jgi:uncharacterized protein with HEPN domain
MEDRSIYRLHDVVDAINQIDALLKGKDHKDFVSDRFLRAAFERFLEILSEASRHIPDELKVSRSDIQWRRIADIGNVLRHAYNRVDSDILWELHAGGDLAVLRDAVRGFLSTPK